MNALQNIGQITEVASIPAEWNCIMPIKLTTNEFIQRAIKIHGDRSRTFNRFSELSDLGYNIKYIWESDWKNWNKSKVGEIPLTTYVAKEK